VNAAIPVELSAVIDRLLEKRPAKRFANAAAVADSLTRILHQRQNRRPSLTTRLRSWERRHQVVSWTAATVLIAAAGLLAWSKLLPNNQPGLFNGPANGAFFADESSRSRSTDALTESTSEELPTSRDKSQPAERGPTAVDIVTADRVEFDRSLESVNEWLNRQNNTGSAAESDSFSEYRLELSSLEQTLRAIDPTTK
jgi:hypothetical protein